MCLELGRGLLTLVVVVAILVAWGECGSNGGATEAAEYGGNVSPAAGTGALDDVGAVGLVGFKRRSIGRNGRNGRNGMEQRKRPQKSVTTTIRRAGTRIWANGAERPSTAR